MVKLQELQDKWMGLSKRERWMIFGAGLIGVIGMIDTFMLEPLRQEMKMSQEQATQFQADATKAQLQATTFKVTASGGNKELIEQINAVQTKIKLQQDAMQNVSALMVKPDAMLPLLKSLLAKHHEVEVVNLESLPVDNFIKKHVVNDKSDSVTTTAELTTSGHIDESLNEIYQHTIKLTLRGDYQAVMRYAQALKKHAGVLSWESAEMKAQYPKTELTIHLYTLSMQNAWLGI